MSTSTLAVIPEIIEQHAEEAAFLWLLRDQAIGAPHYDLKDLAELDDRVEAHIDGLRISGEFGWELCREALAHEEAGEGFAAGVLALESRDGERLEAVFEAASASPELARGVVSAFGWIPFARVTKIIEPLLASAIAPLRRLAVSACAIHREDPFNAVRRALDDEEPTVRGRGLKAAGELGLVRLRGHLQAHLRSKDRLNRYYAARSLALIGDKKRAAPILVATAETPPESEKAAALAEEACAIAVRTMTASSTERWIKKLAQEAGSLRLAFIACGAWGDPKAIPSLIKAMKTPTVARTAGEAFARITGVDIAYDDLEGDWPDGFEAGPSEAPEDEDVRMDADEDLPFPDVQKIEAWWRDNQSRFSVGQRYLMGQPITPAQLDRVLRTGTQRQRAAAAIEQAIAEPGRPLFEVRAPGFVQQRLLKD